MEKDILKKIVKNKNNRVLILIVIIGLIFISFIGGTTKDNATTKNSAPILASEEERLKDILEDIDGAGKVSVMITYYGTNEKNIAYEKRKNTTLVGGGNESYDEKAVMNDGEPMVINEVYPKVKGVIVTAEGAYSASIQEKLTRAVMAALDVEAHKICIYKKGGN